MNQHRLPWTFLKSRSGQVLSGKRWNWKWGRPRTLKAAICGFPSSTRVCLGMGLHRFRAQAFYARQTWHPIYCETSASTCFALFSTSTTWLRETVGWLSRNSLMESPASRYSIRMRTGTRVPEKTGVPPRMSVSLLITGLKISGHLPSKPEFFSQVSLAHLRVL